MSDKVLFLMTIDCDHLRQSSTALRRDALNALLDVFAETGVAGHSTWFVNESYYDYSLTESHEPALHEMIRRGDTLGVQGVEYNSTDAFEDMSATHVLSMAGYCKRIC